jgi:hypothetical protein
VDHKMATLMANYSGATGEWVSTGKSAIWSENGMLVTVSGGTGEELVVATRRSGVLGWRRVAGAFASDDLHSGHLDIAPLAAAAHHVCLREPRNRRWHVSSERARAQPRRSNSPH